MVVDCRFTEICCRTHAEVLLLAVGMRRPASKGIKAEADRPGGGALSLPGRSQRSGGDRPKFRSITPIVRRDPATAAGGVVLGTSGCGGSRLEARCGLLCAVDPNLPAAHCESESTVSNVGYSAQTVPPAARGQGMSPAKGPRPRCRLSGSHCGVRLILLWNAHGGNW